MIHRLVRNRHDPRSESIWLTVYADMMTNLMLVFLALYGLTVMGQDAVATAVQSMTLRPASTPMPKFRSVAPRLKEAIGQLAGVTISEEVGAVRVQFGENVLFTSGRAALKPAAIDPLIQVGEILKSVPHTIVVEGHTDPVPLTSNAEFRTNYELSLARAMTVVRLLIDQAKVPAGQVAAAAYGEHRPRDSNETADGRRKNRRVEIAIFRDYPYPPAVPKP